MARVRAMELLLLLLRLVVVGGVKWGEKEERGMET